MEDMNIGLSVKRVNLYTGREENAFFIVIFFPLLCSPLVNSSLRR